MTHLVCDFCGHHIYGNWVKYGAILFHPECFLLYLRLLHIEDDDEE